jgi:hypothetical protein
LPARLIMACHASGAEDIQQEEEKFEEEKNIMIP